MKPELSMAETRKQIRKTAVFRALIPMEAEVGWPIPVRKGGRVYVTFPFYRFKAVGPGHTTLYPPFATITLDWETKRPVEYVNLRYRNPWPEGDWTQEAGVFPHEAVRELGPVSRYLELQEELFRLYDEVLALLASNSPIPDAINNRFGELLSLLMEPSLAPYYRALAPKFFDRFLAVADAVS